MSLRTLDASIANPSAGNTQTLLIPFARRCIIRAITYSGIATSTAGNSTAWATLLASSTSGGDLTFAAQNVTWSLKVSQCTYSYVGAGIVAVNFVDFPNWVVNATGTMLLVLAATVNMQANLELMIRLEE